MAVNSYTGTSTRSSFLLKKKFSKCFFRNTVDPQTVCFTLASKKKIGTNFHFYKFLKEKWRHQPLLLTLTMPTFWTKRKTSKFFFLKWSRRREKKRGKKRGKKTRKKRGKNEEKTRKKRGEKRRGKTRGKNQGKTRGKNEEKTRGKNERKNEEKTRGKNERKNEEKNEGKTREKNERKKEFFLKIRKRVKR